MPGTVVMSAASGERRYFSFRLASFKEARSSGTNTDIPAQTKAQSVGSVVQVLPWSQEAFEDETCSMCCDSAVLPPALTMPFSCACATKDATANESTVKMIVRNRSMAKE